MRGGRRRHLRRRRSCRSFAGRAGEGICVLGIDRDPEAIERAPGRSRLDLAVGNFGEIDEILRMREISEVAGVLFDLGVSGHQLDTARRGFSYRRKDRSTCAWGRTPADSAEEVVNRTPAPQLARIIRNLGEERFAHRVAGPSQPARPITDTRAPGRGVKKAIPAATRRSGGHPARRTFQDGEDGGQRRAGRSFVWSGPRHPRPPTGGADVWPSPTTP